MNKENKFLEKYALWGNSIAKNWENKDIDSNVAAFSQCHTYLETPFSENAAEISNGIKCLWEEIRLQSKITINVNLISAQTGLAVFSYVATFKENNLNHESLGIWVVEFEQDMCVSFRQWFNIRGHDT